MPSPAADPAVASPAEVLSFWFDGARVRPEWFRKDELFDRTIRQRFGTTVAAALAGGLDAAWQSSPEARLAQIVVLDQFTRNAHRGTPLAFAGDARALALARAMVDAGHDQGLQPPVQRQFVYLPFEHAENPEDQRRGLQLFERLAQADPQLSDLPEWSRRHLQVIERFGRFPHRNRVLGRLSTPEEELFLQQPGSSF